MPSPFFAQTTLVTLGLALIFPVAGYSNGTERNGTGAESEGKGGASITDWEDPFASMALNPSLLGHVTAPEIALSANAGFGFADYDHPSGNKGDFNQNFGLFGDLVVRIPLGENL